MRFKRSINCVIGVVVFMFTLGMIFKILYATMSPEEYAIWKLIIDVLLVFIPIIAWGCFVPLDFDYYIKVNGDIIIIETERDDCRRFNKDTMMILLQTRKKIVLYDGLERATLNYNTEMLEFLEEIKQS